MHIFSAQFLEALCTGSSIMDSRCGNAGGVCHRRGGREKGNKKGSFFVRGSMCSSQNEFHLIYKRKSRQPPSLSWREKPFRKTAEINQCVGPWCSLCGLGQRWSHCKQPLALMMCSEPVEACKSAAGISFSVASIPT